MRTMLFTSAAVTAVAIATLAPQAAQAEICLLDTNNSEVSDGTPDTIGGASDDSTDPSADNTSLACGFDAGATRDSVALGFEATANQTNSIVIGARATTNGEGNIAIGANTTTNGAGNIAIGDWASTGSVPRATALGTRAHAQGTDSVAIGAYSRALDANTVSFGSLAWDLDGNGTVDGTEGLVHRRLVNVADPWNAQDAATKAYVDKLGSRDSVNNKLSLGGGTANGSSSIAIGPGAWAQENSAVLGIAASAAAESVAIGSSAKVQQTNSIAIGANSTVNSQGSVGIGDWAGTTGFRSVALGTLAKANAEGAVAIGASSVANVDNTVSVGNALLKRKIVNVAIGDSDFDAVNYSQIRDFLTWSQIETQLIANSYLDEDGVNTLLSTKAYLDEAGVNNLLSTKAYLDEGGVNNLLSSKNYLDEAGVNTLLTDGGYVNTTTVGEMITTGISGSTVISDLTKNFGTVNEGVTRSVALGFGSIATASDTISVGRADDPATTDTNEAFTRKIVHVTDGKVEEHSSEAVTGHQLWELTGRVDTLATTGGGGGGGTLDFHAASSTVAPEPASVVDGITDSHAIGHGSIADDHFTISVGRAFDDNGTPEDTSDDTTELLRRLVNVKDGQLADGSTEAVTGNQLYGTNQRVGKIEKYVAFKTFTNPDAANAEVENSVAIGGGAAALGNAAIALGSSAKARSVDSIAIGRSADAHENEAVALGYSANAKGIGSIAIGGSSEVDENSTAGIALGEYALVQIADPTAGLAASVAIGQLSWATESGTVSFGRAAYFDDNNNGIEDAGEGAFQRRLVNVADGQAETDAATVGQLNDLAIGQVPELAHFAANGAGTARATVSGAGATALGANASAGAAGSLALGSGAKAMLEDVVALGSGSIANVANTVSIGRAFDDNGTPEDTSDDTTELLRRLVNVDDPVNDQDAATKAYVDGLDTGNVFGNAVFASNVTAARATGSDSSAIGDGAVATTVTADLPSGPRTTPATGAQAYGANAMALGASSLALGPDSLAGSYDEDTGIYSAANDAVAIGARAVASDISATALGSESTASGGAALAAGRGSTASGGQSIALGYTSKAEENEAIAIGNQSLVLAHEYNKGSIAFGSNSWVDIVDLENDPGLAASVAIGANSTATESGTVSFGRAVSYDANSDGTIDPNEGVFQRRLVNVDDPVNPHDAATKAYVDRLGAYYTARASIQLGGGSVRANHSVAIGLQAISWEDYTTAIGRSAEAKAERSLALGSSSVVDLGSLNAIAIGNASYVDENLPGSIAIGDQASVIIDAPDHTLSPSIALGAGSVATESGTVSFGNAIAYDANDDDNIDPNEGVFQRRLVNVAKGTAATDAVNLQQLTDAISGLSGGGDVTELTYLSASGAGTATVNGAGATALGSGANAGGPGALAFGGSANATGGGATAIGNQSVGTGLNAVALGNNTRANMASTVSIGDAAIASGLNAVAVGGRATATGSGSMVLGSGSTANRDGAMVVGSNALAQGTNGTAIGNGAIVLHDNSTALGQGARTSAVNQVELGATGSSVAIGDINASTEAQDGQLYMVTVDENGTLGKGDALDLKGALSAVETSMRYVAAVSDAQFAALDGRVASLEGQVNTLFDLAEVDRKDTRQGLAAVAAMAQPHFPSEAGKTSYASNVAVHRGTVGFSAGLMHRFEGDFAITAGATYAGGDSATFRAGIAGEF